MSIGGTGATGEIGDTGESGETGYTGEFGVTGDTDVNWRKSVSPTVRWIGLSGDGFYWRPWCPDNTHET